MKVHDGQLRLRQPRLSRRRARDSAGVAGAAREESGVVDFELGLEFLQTMKLIVECYTNDILNEFNNMNTNTNS